MTVPTLALSLLGAPLLQAQGAAAVPKQLAVAIIRAAADELSPALTKEGPLLLDSVSLKRAVPGQSADGLAREVAPNARATLRSAAITCVPSTLRCAVVNHGVLVTIDSVNATSDAAAATVTLHWTVASSRRGDTVMSKTVEMHLARRPSGWAVVSSQTTGRT